MSETTPSMAEVDRILDKLGAEGIGSLTPQEREILEKASQARRK